MARKQTVFSELQVLRGIVGDKFLDNVSEEHQAHYHEELLARHEKNPKSVIDLLEAGHMIARNLRSMIGDTPYGVVWTGNNKEPAFNQVPKDLFINKLNLRISVKENARLISNHSPTNTIDVIGGKTLTAERKPDWFMTVAPEEHQAYFDAIKGKELTGYATPAELYEHTTKDQRKAMFANFTDNEDAYRTLTSAVAGKTATLIRSLLHKKYYEHYLYYFFRLNAVSYILCGVDTNGPFVVRVPTNADFAKRFKLIDVNARAHDAAQAEIYFEFKFINLETNEPFSLSQRMEIRWSHGRFCGNPEGKLYAYQWLWRDLPWVETL